MRNAGAQSRIGGAQAAEYSNRVSFSPPDENGDVVMHVITSGKYELTKWLRYMGDEVELIKPLKENC